jgi:putative transposase
MARPLRIEYPGALYHVTTRGNRAGAIFVDIYDRQRWLAILARICTRFNLVVHAYCQMTNHYHLMVETVEGNLSQAMRQLNASYAQYFNHRHILTGHVVQGRYKAILVQKEAYLLELSRYIILNPVRAGMVEEPEDWPWSSYNAVLGRANCPAWLNIEWVLRHFGESTISALPAYQRFICEGIGASSPLEATRHQIVLGSADFVELHLQRLKVTSLTAIAKEQRRLAVQSLQQFESTSASRSEAMARAYFSTAYTMVAIGKHFNVSCQTVGRAVKRFEMENLL